MNHYERVTTIVLSAFGTIGVLSALCYSAIPCFDNDIERKKVLYAAEKFLDSSLLIIQTLFLKFALDQILAIEFVKKYNLAKKCISWIF